MPASLTISELLIAVPETTEFAFQFLSWIQGESALTRVWSYLNHKFRVGNIEVSATSLVLGLIVFLVALVAARLVSSLLQRRITARIAKLFRTRGIKLGQPVQELRLSRAGLSSDNAASLLDEERDIDADASARD